MKLKKNTFNLKLISMKYIGTLFSTLVLSIGVVCAQTIKEEVYDKLEKAGGVYFAYPENSIVAQTPPPKSYEAFYISHFGRHGSRYLISDDQYKTFLDLLDDAAQHNALSDLGKDVLQRLAKVWEEAEFRGGDLSPLGLRQQRGIAERMYFSYPKVFQNNAELSAQSTTVLRCALSMDAFSERLKELNPKLDIPRDASMKYQRYLNFHTKESEDFNSSKSTWIASYIQFENSHIQPERLVRSLFTDNSYIQKRVNGRQLMLGLYEIAVGMQNIETKLSFFDIFERQELFNLWQCKNYRNYVSDGNAAVNEEVMFGNAKPVLKDILDRADQMISTKGSGAAFRFAHDGNIIPLAMLLHLDNTYNSVSDNTEFYKAWSNFKVAPMAGNIQMVFYRSKKNPDDVIVKFMLHENEVLVPPVKTDMAPYYHWKDVRSYYQSLLDR